MMKFKIDDVCPMCGSSDLDIMKVFEDVSWGSKSFNLPRGIVLKNVMKEFTHCFSCHEDFYTFEQSKEETRRIRTAMVLRIIELEDYKKNAERVGQEAINILKGL